jgi:hypothetical protein
MFNLDVSEASKKEQEIAGLKLLQIQAIVREDMNISFPDLHKKYKDEMNWIAVSIQSIIIKATKESKDASNDSAEK